MAHIPDWNGVLLTLADMPWIAPQTYSLVAARLSASTISLPVFNGLPGHPVGFGRDFYQELRSLSGDVGAKPIVQKYAQHVRKLPLDDPAIRQDVDFPSDLGSRSRAGSVSGSATPGT